VAGFWASGSGRAVLVPGVMVCVLPASRAEIPPFGGFLWAVTRFLPSLQVVSALAPLPGLSGRAWRAGSLSAVQDGMGDRDRRDSMGDPSAHGAQEAGEGMDARTPPRKAHQGQPPSPKRRGICRAHSTEKMGRAPQAQAVCTSPAAESPIHLRLGSLSSSTPHPPPPKPQDLEGSQTWTPNHDLVVLWVGQSRVGSYRFSGCSRHPHCPLGRGAPAPHLGGGNRAEKSGEGLRASRLHQTPRQAEGCKSIRLSE